MLAGGLGLLPLWLLTGCSSNQRDFSPESTAGADGGAGGDVSNEAGGGGAGPEVRCEPNQPVCDGNRVALCNATGTGYQPGGQECSSTEVCAEGECERQECTPGERFCEGTTVRLCADDGLSSEEEGACLTDEYCEAASATCQTGVCSPEEPACDGNRATVCNADGSGYSTDGQTCTASETCSAGECRPQICEPGRTYCQGEDVKTCSVTGLSSTIDATCTNQACVETTTGASCSGLCSPGEKQCSGNGVQTCTATGTWDLSPCPDGNPMCASGACGPPASCTALPAACGSNSNDSCCSSPALPSGGYDRSNDPTYPATVSAFRLDSYEITVGRFRNFVEAYSQDMIPAGSGKNPNSPADSGWSTDWNASLPADTAALRAALKCYTGQQNNNYETWTDTVSGNELRPINCLSWYVAAAFCIWDGGRLPTEAEWNYAAAGGSQQRLYPWGSAAPGNDASRAVFGCYFGGIPDAGCVDVTNIAPVGVVSAGNGRWGQADLGGNMKEWIADWSAIPYAQPTCNDCINTSGTAQMHRVARGGYWSGFESELRTAYRNGYHPTSRDMAMGARCAREQ